MKQLDKTALPINSVVDTSVGEVYSPSIPAEASPLTYFIKDEVNGAILMEVGKWATLTIKQAADSDFHTNYSYAKYCSTLECPKGNLAFYVRYCRQKGYLK